MDILDRHLVNFEVIANLGAGHKLSVVFGECLKEDPPSIIQPVARSWRGDDHLKVLSKIEYEVQTMEFIVTLLMQNLGFATGVGQEAPYDETTCAMRRVALGNIHKIHKKLYESVAGFDRLVATYSVDPNIASRFLDQKMHVVAQCVIIERFLTSHNERQLCGVVSFD